MPRSHASAPAPSFLLALVALGIVARFRPSWLAVELKTASAEHDVRPERLSRLTSRAIAGFEHVVATLTRRGRPPRNQLHDEAHAELLVTRALLETTSAVLARVTLRGRRVRELVVGAYERLTGEHAITQKRFCEALSLPVRTLRHWLTQERRRRQKPAPQRDPACPACGCEPSPAPTPKPAPKPPPSPRPPRRPRFGFDVLLPGNQIGADTTDLSAFGVALKLIAAQDIGGRDQSLFDAVLVDDHESAEHVAAVLKKALEDRPGAQAITDQGTPYLAEHTRDALAVLEADHAPQREADPLGKATVERAFRSLKGVAEPLLALTGRAADAWPALRDTSLATAVTTLLFTALLRAYQHGGRAARAAVQARGGINPGELARLAEHSRERARATERSNKLLLQHLHAVYHLAGKVTDFVRTFRAYPLTVLRDAEAALRNRLARDDLEPVRDPWRYFGAVVRRLFAEHQRLRARRRFDHEQNREHDRRHREHAERIAAFRADPVAWLRHALELVASQWLPATGTLLCGGEGYGLGNMRAALRRIHETHGAAARDVAAGTLHAFQLDHAERLGDQGLGAIAAILDRELAKLGATHDCAPAAASAILARTGKTPRPPPSGHLPI